MNSLIVAKEYDKKHSEVRFKISKLLRKEPRYRKHVIESTYTNTRNRQYPFYEFTETGMEKVLDMFENCKHSHSIDNEYIDFIERLFPKEESMREFPVPGTKLRIDLAFIGLGLFIEIDGEYHERKKQKKRDAERDQVIIENLLNMVAIEIEIEGREMDITPPADLNYYDYFSFIRIKEGELAEGILQIMAAVENVTGSSILELDRSKPSMWYDRRVT